MVARALAGDQSAFVDLVRKYQDRCVGIAKTILHDAHAARDVAQEAFVRLYRSLQRYDPSQRFYTWFYRMVVHLAIDQLRKDKRRRKTLEQEREGYSQSVRAEHSTSESSGPLGMLESQEQRERIRRVLQTLPIKYQILLVLRDAEGFTSKEISEIAHWNHATVRWRLHRARALFREAWERSGYGGDES